MKSNNLKILTGLLSLILLLNLCACGRQNTAEIRETVPGVDPRTGEWIGEGECYTVTKAELPDYCQQTFWLAGEQWRMDAFKRGDDIYCASASQMFGVPVVKHGINGELRQKGKVAELACGYGGAAGALISMGALDMGLSEDELPGLIDDWRTANPHIVQFWWDVEKAAMDTVKDHRERNVGRIGFQFYANTLWVVLPSGRKLAYIKPRLQPNRFGRMAMTFESLNAANKWSRGETYSGKLVENCTQSTARDLLAEAMWRMEQAGLDIVGHVHDEVILEVPKGTITVEDVCSIMNQNPVWANGLVLSSAGYRGDYYFKD